MMGPGAFPIPSIPRARYIDERFYQLELDSIFRNAWIPVGHVTEFEKNGDYRVLDTPTAPIFIVKGDDEQLRAFLNSCRHRGASVLKEDSGCCRAFSCQYHGWTYGTDGSLIGVPEEQSFAGLDRSEHSLIELRCDTWGGLIFVNQNTQAVDLKEWLGPLWDKYLAIVSAPLRIVERKSWTIDCNWKLALEAFRESYHVSTIHRNTLAPMVDSYRGSAEIYANGHNTLYAGYNQDLLEQLKKHEWQEEAQQSSLPLLPLSSSPEFTQNFVSSGIFPNINIPFQPSAIPLQTFWPIGKGKSRMDMTWLGMDWGTEDLPEEWRTTLAAFDDVIDEDLSNLCSIQRSIEAEPSLSIPLSLHETLIYQFHAELDRAMGSDNVPEALSVAEIPLPSKLKYY